MPRSGEIIAQLGTERDAAIRIISRDYCFLFQMIVGRTTVPSARMVPVSTTNVTATTVSVAAVAKSPVSVYLLLRACDAIKSGSR